MYIYWILLLLLLHCNGNREILSFHFVPSMTIIQLVSMCLYEPTPLPFSTSPICPRLFIFLPSNKQRYLYLYAHYTHIHVYMLYILISICTNSSSYAPSLPTTLGKLNKFLFSYHFLWKVPENWMDFLFFFFFSMWWFNYRKRCIHMQQLFGFAL